MIKVFVALGIPAVCIVMAIVMSGVIGHFIDDIMPKGDDENADRK